MFINYGVLPKVNSYTTELAKYRCFVNRALSIQNQASRISFKFCISVIRICFRRKVSSERSPYDCGVFRSSDLVLIFYPPWSLPPVQASLFLCPPSSVSAVELDTQLLPILPSLPIWPHFSIKNADT